MRRALGGLAGGGILLLSLHASRASPRLRAEVKHVPMLNHAAEVHVSADSREWGVCSPAAVFSLTRMGDPLLPRPETYALSSHGPAGGSLGMTLTPLRSCGDGLQVSVFGLDMAYEASGGSTGSALQVGVLKVDFTF